MFKGLGNIAELMRKAQELRQQTAELTERLKRLKVEGNAGGGMVVVEMNGQQQLLSCRIEPSLLTGGDREVLEDLVTGAVNQALEKSRQLAADEMTKQLSGLELGGMEGMLAQLGLSRG